MNHKDFIVFEKMYLDYTGGEFKIKKTDRDKAEKLYKELHQEDQVLRGVTKPAQRELGEIYKEYIRDANRLNNGESLTKYGTTIDELRNRVSDFQDQLKAGTATEPNIPRPNK